MQEEEDSKEFVSHANGFDAIAKAIERANSYFELFGEGGSTQKSQTKHVKQTYRWYAGHVHPDLQSDPVKKEIAENAFRMLTVQHSLAKEAISNGNYGQKIVLAKFSTPFGTHEILEHIPDGDLSDVFHSRTLVDGRELATITKVVKNPEDADLLQREQQVLELLNSTTTGEQYRPFVTSFIDSFAYEVNGQPARQANVIGVPEKGFLDLEKLKKHFPNGLDPLHGAWIWRRVLTALGFAHDNDVIHGAVFPPHILVHPEKHGVVLADWSYSQTMDVENFSHIDAIVNRFKQWYPPEVENKQPPTPATDISMAARSMVFILGGDPLTGEMSSSVPVKIQRHLKGCMVDSQRGRPQSAWQALGEFDDLLEDLGGKFFPRKFRTLDIKVPVMSR